MRQALPLRSPRTPRAGEKTFVQCRACHQIGEAAKNEVGPVLNGLFGRKAGTVEGYSYSPANKNSGITWDEATLAVDIKGKAKVPSTARKAGAMAVLITGLKVPRQSGDAQSP